jgi:hypothetical protein
MTLFTVVGCVTDIEGATPYLCQPAADKNKAVDAWYIAACDNLGVNPDAFPPASADHEALIDTAYSLRTYNVAFLDGEALALHSFELGGAA